MDSSGVVVIIGCGGMGLPLARRLGTGRRLFLADFSKDTLSATLSSLTDDGFSVNGVQVDISDFTSVENFAKEAAAAGPIEVVVHTAGLSPSAGSTKQILEVNLLGTANVMDAFLAVARRSTSLVCISSMAAHMGPGLEAELERHLGVAPRDQLLDHADLQKLMRETEAHGSGRAYVLSKRGNVLRVQAAAAAWGRVGARVNSVSPGVISTAAGRQEIAGPAGKFVPSSPAQRVGTPQDIVNAVAFLASRESSFITGVDLLVDGGVCSMLRWSNTEDGGLAKA